MESIRNFVSSFCRRSRHKSYPDQLIITFRVSGTDHTGYCSGQDGGEDIEPYEEIITLPNSRKFTYVDLVNKTFDLSELDFYQKGCSTTGSGYCENIGLQYTCIKVRVPIEN